MGRRLPIEVSHSSIQPAISLVLIFAWMAAFVAAVTALCGVRSKKSSATKTSLHRKSPSFSSAQGKASEEAQRITTTTTTTEAAAATTTETTAVEAETPGPLPLPPALQSVELEQRSAASSPRKGKEAISFPWMDDQWGSPKSRRGKMGSLSMKLPDTLSRIKTGKEMLRRKLHGDGDKAEDSLWTKTIMLGEKNRVPNGGIGADDDENINHEDNGNTTSNFPSKTPRSLPGSRSSSYIDPKAVPTRKL